MTIINQTYKKISVVIIGLNVEKSLHKCIKSVLDADYPKRHIEVIYVDGGSHDDSIGIAKSYKKVRVIELNDPHPTPGKGRNAGINAARYQIIQFLDADTELNPAWFNKALPYLSGDVAAVIGKVREKYKEKNIYHIIGDMEWNISAGKKGYVYSEGPVKIFGGIVLIKKKVIEDLSGYDEMLVAGEDPDVSYRLRQNGWSIYRIDKNMVIHDLNMNTFGQYLKRAYRSGHAYAEIATRYRRDKERFFQRQTARIILGACTPACVFIFTRLIKKSPLGFVISLIIILRPFFKVFNFANQGIGLIKAILYCFHLSFVIYPQFFGVLRYIYTLFGGKPLQNTGIRKKS